MVDLVAQNPLIAAQLQRAEYSVRRPVESEDARRKKAPNEFPDSELQQQSGAGFRRAGAREDVVQLSPEALDAVRAAESEAREQTRTESRGRASEDVSPPSFSGSSEAGDSDRASAIGLTRFTNVQELSDTSAADAVGAGVSDEAYPDPSAGNGFGNGIGAREAPVRPSYVPLGSYVDFTI